MPGVGTTHHIQLGGHYYLLKPGSYQKKVAPQFGARFTTGDPDYNNLSIWQHWAQKCFVGGMDAEVWEDDAMYDDGVGVDTTKHEMVRLSRDLLRGGGSNWAVGATSRPRKFVIYNNKLYCVTVPETDVASTLWEYVPASDGWTQIATFPASFHVYAIGTFDGKLFVGGRTVASTTVLRYSTGTLATWTTITNPTGVTEAVTAFRSFQQKLYVAYGAQIWRLKDNQTWDGNVVFYKTNANSESNYITAMESHLGFLYMLSQNGHIHRTDGNSTFDIWNWDGGTRGVALRSFDGRLFVITYEYTETANTGFGVLYQMSGSAVTQLKRWGKDTEANIIGSLTVHDRRLFYGASNLLGMQAGFGVAVYDPIEDAHSILASNSDTTSFALSGTANSSHVVDDVIFFKGYMFVSVRGHGLFKTQYKPQDAKRSVIVGTRTYDISKAGAQPNPQNGGWLTTSTYDAGTVGLRKLWRKITVDYSIPNTNTSIHVEYSTNEGQSWTSCGTITAVGNRVNHTFTLDNVIANTFKLRFTLRSVNQLSSPHLFGFVVSYLPLPEPNWMWTFTIVLPLQQKLLDGTTETVDTEAELAFLSSTYRTKAMIVFQDIDGTYWSSSTAEGTIIYDLIVWVPNIHSTLEGEVQVTLLESLETV